MSTNNMLLYFLSGLWSQYTKLPTQTPTPQFLKLQLRLQLRLRLLRKISIRISNGKPIKHFITTT
jgi:hypothetical protein